MRQNLYVNLSRVLLFVTLLPGTTLPSRASSLISDYLASGSASPAFGGPDIYNGPTVEVVNNPSGATYYGFYSEHIIDPVQLIDITNYLAISHAYSMPGAMGVSAYIAAPALGSGQTPLAVLSVANLFEAVAPSNGQLNGSISLQYSLHGADTLNLNPYNPGTTYPAGSLGLMLSAGGTTLDDLEYTGYSDQTSFVQEVGLADGRVTFPIVNGVADINLHLLVEASCSATVPSQGSCQENADYLHTLNIGGAQVFDVNGIAEPSVTIGSASGFNYNAPLPSTVPEPKTSVLLFGGLIALLLRFSRSRSSASSLLARVNRMNKSQS